MGCGPEEFCSDLNGILKASGVAGRPQIAAKLKALLANPEFAAAAT